MEVLAVLSVELLPIVVGVAALIAVSVCIGLFLESNYVKHWGESKHKGSGK